MYMGTKKEHSERIIGHLDMDAFFAAVEERDNPELRGKPVVVGADPRDGQGRGVVSTANYVARQYGIRSALPITRAWKFSQGAVRRGLPPAVFVRGSFEKYGEVSRNIMEIVESFAPDMQKVSVDETYFDLSFTGSFEEAKKLAKKIKRQIYEQEKLTASVGVGPNKLVAKIASDYEKPDGLTVVTDWEKESWLGPMPVRKIPGIGPKMQERLKKLGVERVEQLREYAEEELREMYGKWGLSLYQKARGIGSATLSEERIAKSMGRQRTFFQDTWSFKVVMEKVVEICEETIQRMARHGFRQARTVTVIVRFADFTTLNRSHTPVHPVKTAAAAIHEAVRLLLPFFDARGNPQRKAIRLVGVRLEKLS